MSIDVNGDGDDDTSLVATTRLLHPPLEIFHLGLHGGETQFLGTGGRMVDTGDELFCLLLRQSTNVARHHVHVCRLACLMRLSECCSKVMVGPGDGQLLLSLRPASLPIVGEEFIRAGVHSWVQDSKRNQLFFPKIPIGILGSGPL